MFKKLLKKMIDEKYANNSKFADEAGLSPGHLSDILSGRRSCKESSLDKILIALNLNKEKERELVKEWSFEKTGNKLRKEFEELETNNKEMKAVLDKVKNERILLEEIDTMKSYEEFYNNIFKGLTKDEALEVVKAITEKLKIIAIDKGKYEETKENFENIENITKKIK
ncbi:MAG: hypothetical protein ACK5NU_16485 [Fusobacterium ulcerans]|uniref:hypothetical protein n=1 Tax=Fusobacterium ulcerans TaxID=861 RepID=UPI003A8488C3